MASTIAALFVATNGCYFGLDGIEPWDVTRDARLYDGPHPVIAHPPCERFGRWAGARAGEDDGCFASALAAVRAYGGVIEHPADSLAWHGNGLTAPPRKGGWISAGDGIGWTCCVEQGHYGHRARKATWLYVAHTERPALTWGPSEATIKPRPGRDPCAREKDRSCAADVTEAATSYTSTVPRSTDLNRDNRRGGWVFRDEVEAHTELRRAKASRARHMRNRAKYG